MAEELGWEVGVFLFDEIFVRSEGRTSAEVEALARKISEEVSRMWDTRVELRAPERAQGPETGREVAQLVKLLFLRSKTGRWTSEVAFLEKKSFHILFDHVKTRRVSST